MQDSISTINNLLLQILDIINYSKDKTEYVDDFDRDNRMEAIANLADKLPEEYQNRIDLKQEDFEKLQQFVSGQDLDKEVERVAKEQLKKLVEKLSPDFNDEQKQKIDAIVKSLDEPATPQTPVEGTTPHEVPPPMSPPPMPSTDTEVPQTPSSLTQSGDDDHSAILSPIVEEKPAV